MESQQTENSPGLSLEHTMDLLLHDAQAGNPEAMFQLGKLYLDEENSAYNPQLGLKWLKKCAPHKDIPALAFLAFLYFYGKPGLPHNYKLAVKYALQAVTSGTEGIPQARFLLALARESGHGLPLNLEEAFHLFQLSAKEDCPQALRKLGECYLTGKGCKKNARKAVECYRKAAQMGDPIAYFSLAQCLEAGIGTQKNPEQCLESYRTSAEAGFPEAQYQLATFYHDGFAGILEPNWNEAMLWYQKAADQNHPLACLDLFLCYREQNQNMTPEVWEKILPLLKKAVDFGLPPAQYILGQLHLEGYGVQQDEAMAFQLFHSAATQGYPKAQVFLGKCHTLGIGTKTNPRKGFQWFQKAAAQDEPEALVKLAIDKLYGYVNPKDEKKGFAMMKKLAASGNPYACGELGYCYFTGKGTKTNRKLGIQWYLKAAEKDDSASLYVLGNIFMDGEGCPPDTMKALQFFRRAAELGEPKAQFNLAEHLILVDGNFPFAQEILNLHKSPISESWDSLIIDCYLKAVLKLLLWEDAEPEIQNFTEVVSVFKAENPMAKIDWLTTDWWPWLRKSKLAPAQVQKITHLTETIATISQV